MRKDGSVDGKEKNGSVDGKKEHGNMDGTRENGTDNGMEENGSKDSLSFTSCTSFTICTSASVQVCTARLAPAVQLDELIVVSGKEGIPCGAGRHVSGASRGVRDRHGAAAPSAGARRLFRPGMRPSPSPCSTITRRLYAFGMVPEETGCRQWSGETA